MNRHLSKPRGDGASTSRAPRKANKAAGFVCGQRSPADDARRAFTLIEMLTVIAIIGVLAAILLPTISAIRKRAKISIARGQIGVIEQAMLNYARVFGALPPDSNDALPGESTAGANNRFDDMDNPNECMVWFLSRYYSRSGSDDGAPGIAAGVPDHDTYNGNWFPVPKDAETVFARMGQSSAEPFMDFKPSCMKDFDEDGFPEFLDPWGRPYLYRAYLRGWGLDDITHNGGVTRYELTDTEVQNLVSEVGKVRISGCSNSGNNGTFSIRNFDTNTYPDCFEVTNASGSNESDSPGVVRFLLHKPQTCDLFSLGPDGKTRAAKRPQILHDGDWVILPWNPVTHLDIWGMLYGTPGDGNDVESAGGNPGCAEGDQDDVNNWQ